MNREQYIKLLQDWQQGDTLEYLDPSKGWCQSKGTDPMYLTPEDLIVEYRIAGKCKPWNYYNFVYFIAHCNTIYANANGSPVEVDGITKDGLIIDKVLHTYEEVANKFYRAGKEQFYKELT